MGKGGGFDFRQVEKLQRQIEHLKQDQDKIYMECAKYLAARFLRMVKQRTPVDSGALRRNWTIGEVKKQGDHYTVELINQTEYASYVEYGHRTVGRKGWVPGKFMMTISERQLEEKGEAMLEKKIYELIRRAFDA